MSPRRVAIAVVCLAGALLAALVVRAILSRPEPGALVGRTVLPKGIMGTRCTLTAVTPQAHADRAAEALQRAENALRGVEHRMSTYVELSELSRLNAAPARRVVRLSPQTMDVLRLARELHGQTAGAFDATCLPVFALWARAGRQQRVPTSAELAAAKRACGWDKFELLDGGARKTVDAAGVGLGGVAKGFAVDRAAEALRRAGCDGGLVDVGGDIRCFGLSPKGKPWRVAVQDPFQPGSGYFFGMLELTDHAVCTSGNYERFVVIDGQRFSHIVDPRNGIPVDFAPSVTVVAPTAAVADGWATALSVLGKAGLKRIPAASGIEAMIVEGGPRDYRTHQTPGFAKLLVEPVPQPPRQPAQRTAPRAPATKPIPRGD